MNTTDKPAALRFPVRFPARFPALLPVLLSALFPTLADAVDFSVSGFGTVGYTASDSRYRYMRFIDEDGSSKTDSLLGAQMSARFSPQWEASLQAMLAPAQDSDSRWEPTVSWAFLAYRPSNDLLFRLGKLRIPFYLASENMNVGTTYDFMRLPTEVYAQAPATDFTGVSASKTWELDTGELGIDGYRGTTNVYERLYINNAPVFIKMRTESTGLIGTLRQEENSYRIGAHLTHVRPLSTSHPAPPPPPGGGSSGESSGHDNEQTIVAPIYTAGADIALGQGFRVIGELSYRKVQQGAPVNSTRGYYLSLLKRVHAWTPYLMYSETRSTQDRASNNPSNQAASLGSLDQRTWSLGTAYALSPTQKLKAEWMRVRLGEAASLLDVPKGEVPDRVLRVISVSYNFVF